MSKPINRRSFLRSAALGAGAILTTSIVACAPKSTAGDNQAVATAVAQSEEKIHLVSKIVLTFAY
jgi:hypothetical protein